MNWTNEMEIVYKLSKDNKSDEKGIEQSTSNWKSYGGNNYIEKYEIDTPIDIKNMLQKVLNKDVERYITPVVVAAIKKKVSETAVEMSVLNKTDEESKLPEFRYNF